MRDKRIKLIYFSLGGSEVKHINMSWKALGAGLLVAFSSILLVVAVIFAVFTDFYHNFKIESLNRVNTILKEQLDDMNGKVTAIESKIEDLQKRDNDLRVFANLPKLDEETWSAGVGGYHNPGNEYELRFLSKETGDQTLEVKMLLDKLQRKLQLASESQFEIENAIRRDKSVLDHTPSIRPVIGGRITARFGMRLDPFIERVKPHHGIDIAAEVGTKVYAAAHGVVEIVQSRYYRNKGFGKQVVINHGNGYTTRYAHLDAIYVKEGQKVKRWQEIGEIGQTGRSTGPHLHYEVRQQNKPLDPAHFIIQEEI
ncbi:peptidoglycan DD-metalloendopeptidase family protein [candidate division KSB1 bacterium]|nr:peptidoglycan DD-metalloendopeptidase family protein [candidate division KSB1 bacterium]